jgi:hypothetical protein
MSFWSGIFKAKNNKGEGQGSRAVGVLQDDGGWYYEESQNFSRSQSTVRIEQKRPGDWQTLESSCGIVELNSPNRQDAVGSFFAGTYRWLTLERETNGFKANRIKIIGTFRDKAGKERAVHLGYLKQELAEGLEGEELRNLWGRIRFIKFPTPCRSSKYLIRFDLMGKGGVVLSD